MPYNNCCTTQKLYYICGGLCKQLKEKTEIQQILEKTGIRGGVVYYRLKHLIDSGVYDGSVAELKRMLESNDWRLVRLTNEQRKLLAYLTRQRRLL